MTQCIDEGVLRAFLDDALPDWERRRVAAHLTGCDDCADCLAELREISLQVRTLLAGSAPMPNARAAFARVRAEAATDRVASYFANRRVYAPRPLPTGNTLPMSKRIARPWPTQVRFALSGLGVAAVILIALGLAGLFSTRSLPPADTITTSSTVGVAARVGSLAPDFTLLDVKNNQPVSLSLLRGKPVWINFWGTWCPPCREEMPEIQKLYDKYAGQVEVLGVSMGPRDSPEQVISFINEFSYTWTFIHDPDMDVLNSYVVQGIPASYFIDKDGVIRSITVGGANGPTLESNLLKAIAQAPVPVETTTVVETTIIEEPEIFPAEPEPGSVPTQGPVSEVDPPRMPLEEFKELYDNPAKRPLILDVRSKEAYDEGHIAGAASFPEADVSTRVGELPKDELIVAYCQ